MTFSCILLQISHGISFHNEVSYCIRMTFYCTFFKKGHAISLLSDGFHCFLMTFYCIFFKKGHTISLLSDGQRGFSPHSHDFFSILSSKKSYLRKNRSPPHPKDSTRNKHLCLSLAHTKGAHARSPFRPQLPGFTPYPHTSKPYRGFPGRTRGTGAPYLRLRSWRCRRRCPCCTPCAFLVTGGAR